MVPETLEISHQNEDLKGVKWETFVEKAGVWGKAPDFIENGFVDHLNTTKYSMDYLWYTPSLYVDETEGFLKNGSKPILMVESKGHVVHTFINQELQVSASGSGSQISYKFEAPISLKAGKNEIAFLSMTVGLSNAGPFYEWVGAGLTSVKISGLKNGTVDLSSNSWPYKIGLEGEHHNIYREDGAKNVKWLRNSKPPKNQPLTWYKAVINAPKGNEPVGIDMMYMGKGQVWINGKEIGRYWPVTSSKYDKCTPVCDYRGKIFQDKCLTGCGESTQRWYHVPRSWFQPSGNTLVIFEEKGGDPTKITFGRRLVTKICGFISENYPTADLESWDQNIDKTDEGKVTLRLSCPESTIISSVSFASYGNPSGSYGHLNTGSYHSSSTSLVVEKACLNKNGCSIPLSEESFSTDSCPDDIIKSLAVEATCS